MRRGLTLFGFVVLVGVSVLAGGCQDSSVSRVVSEEEKQEAISRRQEYIQNIGGMTQEQKDRAKAAIGGRAPTGPSEEEKEGGTR